MTEPAHLQCNCTHTGTPLVAVGMRMESTEHTVGRPIITALACLTCGCEYPVDNGVVWLPGMYAGGHYEKP